jgi:hypothetical protein
MGKVTGLLVMLAALAIALPAMAQSPNNATGAGAAQPNPNQPQVPQPNDGGVNWEGVGVGAGTVVGNLFYVPAKVVYGVLGGITGGASYLLTGGNTQTANTIWRSSLGGDYVLTPGMVAGQKPIHFSGPTSTAPQPNNQSAMPAASGSTTGSGSSASSFAPTRTASAANPPSVTAASVGGTGASGAGASATAMPQPADRGTGPVGSSGASAPPLPSTSIE